MQGWLSAATPAVISVASLGPLPTPAVAPVGSGFPILSTPAARAGASLSTLDTSSATAATLFGALRRFQQAFRAACRSNCPVEPSAATLCLLVHSLACPNNPNKGSITASSAPECACVKRAHTANSRLQVYSKYRVICSMFGQAMIVEVRKD